MVMKIDDEKFRANFKNLDDAVLISYEHVAAVMFMTIGATYQAAAKGRLPKPAIQSNKLVRWTAGQIRNYLNNLGKLSAVQDDIKIIPIPENKILDAKNRIGRPRRDFDSIAISGV